MFTNNEPGQYTTAVFNDSRNAMAGVPVTDTLPPQVIVSSVNFSNEGYTGNTYDGAGAVVNQVFSGGKVNLQALSRASFRFTGRVAFSDSLPQIMRNVFYAKAPAGFDDPDPSNDTAIFYSYRRPVISQPGNPTICSGQPFTTNLQTMSTATVNWTVATTGNITGAVSGSAVADAAGVLAFSPTLTNTGPTAGTATYTFTPTYTYTNPKDRTPIVVNGLPVNVTYTINPSPNVVKPANVTACPGVVVGPFNFAGNTTGATYTWTNNNTAIGLPATGSGSTINSFTPVNSGSAATTAKIIVMASFGGCITKDSFNITVNPLPGAGFTINNPTQCITGNSFVFTNSTNTGTYLWDFGDGTTATAISPTHVYGATGTFNVKVVHTEPSGCKDSAFRTVNVTPAPVANFIYSIISQNVNNTFQFTDASIVDAGESVSWFWDFGDGSTSTEINPVHTYMQSGNYTVTLTVTGNNGCVSTKTDQLLVSIDPNVSPKFSINNDEQCLTGNQFVFTNSSVVAPGYNIVAYSWDLGDGSAAQTGATVAYTYAAAGTYDVTLTVTTNNGLQLSVRQSVVVIPTATVNQPASQIWCVGEATNGVVFSSPLGGTTYQWTNNNTSIGLAASGTGNISSFTLKNAGTVNNVATITVVPLYKGCAGTPQSFTITARPVPSVNALTPQVLCTGAPTQPIVLSSSVAGTIFSWTNDNPAIGLPAAGTGDIPVFTATNLQAVPVVANIVVVPSANGCTGPQQITTITVKPLPTLNNNLSATAICDKALFSYVPTSATGGTTFAWTRAAVPGISNPAASGTGNPNETLFNTTPDTVSVVYNFTMAADGCTNTQQVTLPVKPTPVLSSSSDAGAICSGDLFYYVPATTTPGTIFTWERSINRAVREDARNDNGAISEVLTNLSSAPITVNYSYRLTAAGCVGNASVSVNVKPTPELNSDLNPGAICSGTPFVYAPSATVTGTTFAWSRPLIDGVSNPAVTGSDGINETLVITDNTAHTVPYTYSLNFDGCTNTQVVNANVLPASQSAFTVDNPAQCLDGNVFTFTNISPSRLPGRDSYIWDFGDETSATTTNAVHSYNAPGIYTVTLYIVGMAGCRTASSQNVIVKSTPTAGFLLNVIAPASNGQFQFTNTSTGISQPLTYLWDFGDGTTSTDVNPQHTYAVAGTYTVTLTATSAEGCNAVASTVLTVAKNPDIVVDFDVVPTSSCITGNLIQYNSTTIVTPGITINEYLWDFGDGNTSTLQTPSHSYAAVGRYTVTLTVQTSAGAATGTDLVEIYPEPVITKPHDRIICAGVQVNNINFASTATSATYTWTNDHPEIGLAANGTGNISAFTPVNNTANPIVATITVTAAERGCAGPPIQFTITVDPVPTVAAVGSQVICAGGTTAPVAFTGTVTGTTFNWVNDDPSIGLGESGTGTIPSFVAVNNTLMNQTALIKVTPAAGSCIGTAVNFGYVITPTAELTSTTMPEPVCGNVPFTYLATTNQPSAVLSWTRAAVPGITNPAGSGTGNINETLENTTGNTITVTYVYTIQVPGCVISTAEVKVQVKPRPTLTSPLSPPDICNNTMFSYAPTANVPGTVFRWTRNGSAVLANPAASGVGSPDEVLVNISNDIARAIYSYSMDANGCVNTQNVVLIVGPDLKLSSSTNPSEICSGTNFSYTATTNNPGAVITWSRPSIPIVGLRDANGSVTINEKLVNITSSPVVVPYTFLLTYRGCSTSVVLNVTVEPAPTLASPLADMSVCAGTAVPAVMLTSNVPGTQWSWKNSNLDIGLGASGNGNIPSFSATAGENTTVTGRITVEGITPAGCIVPAVNNAYNVTVNAVPTGNISVPNGVNFCEGSFVPLIATGGTRYQWYLNGNAIGGATAGLYQARTAGVYTVDIFTAAGCNTLKAGNVTVSGTVKPTAAFNYNTSCQNEPITFINQSLVTGSGPVTYRWSDNAGHTSTAASPVFTYSQSGTYQVKLVVQTQTCRNLADSITQTITVEIPHPGIRLSTVNTVLNSPTQLLARNIGNTAYLWEPATGLNSTTVQNPIATLTADQEYLIRMTTAAGCVTTDSMLVRIRGNDVIFVPNVISPNGDGKNDKWIIPGLNQYPNTEVYIYNRWGNQVYQSKNYDNQWDGDGLNEGTYYYIIKLKLPGGGDRQYKGWVELVR
ncbi:gliding motility-associated C-terminal domain-containing protein [Chitinophaga jiangningensis]|uniref:Gliding motility-associated C-terminal domain-containing protein n=1 Tax=Chitinophaga jiangningensis TaxID=1419482 RepID=A0A1M6Y3H9_9BACT|nr:PKD domain-containing protein [Chitinophaga jiangningensis]SHL12754.1 gliding motility-associated C-terminal domain-containing protein [Chitinophaga jiangningensis]